MSHRPAYFILAGRVPSCAAIKNMAASGGLTGLGGYGSEEDEGDDEAEEEEERREENAAKRFVARVGDGSDDDSDEADGAGAGSGRGSAPQPAEDGTASALTAQPQLLPSADDILASATGLAPALPAQLQPAHPTLVLSGPVPPPAAADAAAAVLARASALPGPSASRASAAVPSADAAKRARDKERESVKARTEKKRKAGQSASFLGGAWKSETEMHFRDNFDS